MYKKLAYGSLGFVLLLSLILSHQSVATTSVQNQSLTSAESEIFNLISGTEAYNYDLQLENIALNQSIGYSFRSSGSSGAEAAANWIADQFESFGLDTHKESFELMGRNVTSLSVQPTTWNLTAKPALIVGDDGNLSTTGDQAVIQSFECEQYSWPTPDGGALGNLVTLPLPSMPNMDALSQARYDPLAWSEINTTGRVLVVGREVTWMLNGETIFESKLLAEPPAAVIFTWSNDWMSWAPPLFSPSGGRDLNFWQGRIPVGWVNYGDGQFLLDQAAKGNVPAWVSIRATIGSGPQTNVIAKLTGSTHPEKMIMICGHYDTVMDAGFCDNGAGTAGVIELARVFSYAENSGWYKPDYSILFIAFAGGELSGAGAVNYMNQHVDELKNIVAVINLDSIGAGNLEISETFADDNGLDLQSIVMKTAQDLGLSVIVAQAGGSDQEVFRNPVDTDDAYKTSWGVETGLYNATRVKSSIMLESYPRLITDNFGAAERPGWTHTQYDNSTSTNALGWVTVDKLEGHISVVGIAVLRVQSTLLNPLASEIYIATSIAFAVAVAVVYFERSRLRPIAKSAKRAWKHTVSYVGLREAIYIVILTAFLMFVSFAIHTRVGRIEVVDNGHPVGINIQYVGAPFEMFGVPVPTMVSAGSGTVISSVTGGVRVLWQGLLLNTVVCSLLAFAITYTVMELKYRHEFPKN